MAERYGGKLAEVTAIGELRTMTRQQLFDALPMHMQAALPTWPLPTREQILHYHAMLRERSA